MLPIATKLLTQRLREVDSEIKRISKMYVSGKAAKWQTNELEKLRGYRKQVVKEMELLHAV